MNGFPFSRLFISIASKFAVDVVPLELELQRVHIASLSDTLIREIPRRSISFLLLSGKPEPDRQSSESSWIHRSASLLISHRLSKNRPDSALFLSPYHEVKNRPTLYFS